MNPNDPYASPGAQVPLSWEQRIRQSSALIPVLALLLLVFLGVAGTLVARQVDSKPGGVFGARTQAEVAASGQTAVTAPTTTAALAPVDTPKPVAAPVNREPIRQPVVRAPAPVAQRAPVCASCGTIESVVALQRSAPGSGVGAVAGGVVGGLLGNQVGGGSGKTAMTVIGAVGGGFAGNAIEKNMKKTTVYQIKVRMDDGDIRTFENGSPPAVGTRVVVDGNSLRAA